MSAQLDLLDQPDTRPGFYYVTMFRDSRYAFLLGPFVNNHAGALAKVDECRKVAEQLDPRCVFDSFGTGRIAPNVITAPKGRLNEYISL